jgi:hypothetical protein
MLSVVFSYCYADRHYTELQNAELRYAEYHYAECHFAECQGTLTPAPTNINH